MKSLSIPGCNRSSWLAHLNKNKKPPKRLFIFVGVPGIEPGPYVPKTYILPIYYTPKNILLS